MLIQKNEKEILIFSLISFQILIFDIFFASLY
jgi:hypothetical protein